MKTVTIVSARTASRVRMGLAGIVVLAAAACGGSAPSNAGQTPATQTTPAPQNAAQAAQQMAQGLQQMAQNQTAAPTVDFEKLVALVPELPGWTRSKPEGKQVSMGVSMSQADAEYTRGDSSINLEIVDSSFNQIVLAPMSMMLMSSYSERTSTGYKKAAPIGGSPGFESWDGESKEGEVTVVVGNRFIVTANGRSVDNIDVVRSLVKSIDLAKLGALK